MNDEDPFWSGLVIGCVIGFIACLFVWRAGAVMVRNDAVKNGVAEYYLDTQHNKQFRWKK